MECLFCNIVNGRTLAFKVWENTDFILILDIKPINPGHLLLIPKNHANDIFTLPDSLYVSLFQIVKKIAPQLKAAMNAVRIGVAIEGFGVPHVHVHLVPLFNGNELNPERAKDASQGELEKVHQKLMSFLADHC